MREEAAAKQKEKDDERLRKVEKNLKAKEYAKKQRELLTKTKHSSSRATMEDSKEPNENDSPNVGNTQYHRDIVQSH